MNLTTVLKTVPLSAKLASANTFVNFASISNSLSMVISLFFIGPKSDHCESLRLKVLVV